MTPAIRDAQGDSAEIIIVDCSASMSSESKLGRGARGHGDALDVIRDGTWFAVIAGTDTRGACNTANGSMAVAGERTRAEAKSGVRELRAGGGTAMGKWLRLARRLFRSCAATLRHAILLADGRNSNETRGESWRQ